MGELILVRHGHTGLNRPGPDERLRGWLDVPLDEQGLREAAETAERISAYPVGAIYCSDLRRARQTADILRKRTKASVTATMELRPWNLGAFAGHRVRDLLPFLNLLNRHPNLAALDGESFYQFYGRYSCRLMALLHLAEQSPTYIVVVTHVRNLLATATILSAGDRDTVPVCGGPATGTITFVRKSGPQWVMSAESSVVSLEQTAETGAIAFGNPHSSSANCSDASSGAGSARMDSVGLFD